MLDGMFNNALGYVSGMFGFFLAKAHILARIFFCMSLGMQCVKMAFGIKQIREALVELLIVTVSYLVMINFFPLMMMGARSAVTNFAKSAVPVKYTSRVPYEELAAWMNSVGSKEVTERRSHRDSGNRGRNASGLKPGETRTTTTPGIIDAAGGADAVLGMNIANSSTGLLSLDKIVVQVMSTVAIMVYSVMDQMEGEWEKTVAHLCDFLIVLAISVFYIFCMCLATVNYAVCVVEYMFVFSIGIVFIPFMLWKGVESYYKTIIGAFAKVLMKLLMISISIYLTMAGSIDIIANMYEASVDGDATLGQRMEFYVGVAFLCVFLKLVADNAGKIAELIVSKGETSLGFKQVKAAVQSVAGAGAVVAGAAMGTAKLAGNVAVTPLKVAGNTVLSAKAGGAAGGLKGAISGGFHGFAGSMYNGAGDILSHVGGIAKSVPGGIGKALEYGMIPNADVSLTAVGFKGMGKTWHERMGTKKAPVGQRGRDGLTDGERGMQSSDGFVRNTAVFDRIREHRMSGKGFFKSIRSAIDDLAVAESNFAPAEFKLGADLAGPPLPQGQDVAGSLQTGSGTDVQV